MVTVKVDNRQLHLGATMVHLVGTANQVSIRLTKKGEKRPFAQWKSSNPRGVTAKDLMTVAKKLGHHWKLDSQLLEIQLPTPSGG